MKYLTYLIYVVFFESLIWGGSGYAVFFLGASAWWFLLAFVVSCCTYSPARWSQEAQE